MSTEIVTVSPESRLEHAKNLMAKHQIRSLPVVREKKVIGIITANDIKKIESER